MSDTTLNTTDTGFHGISGEALLGIEWSMISVALALIVARLYLRLHLLDKHLVWSDMFIILSFVSGLWLCACDIILYRKGVYQSWLDYQMTQFVAPPEEMAFVAKQYYVYYFPFYFEQYFNQFGLLGLYFEIFPRDSHKLRASLICVAVYCVTSFIVTICLVFFACPWGCYWSLVATCGKCQDVSDNVNWAIHFLGDLFIFLLPLVFISQTKMTRSQKISASVTFAMGAVNIVVTFARWVVVQAVFDGIGNPPLTTAEALATTDGHTGLIIAVLPSLRPYLRIWKGADLSARPRELNSSVESDPRPLGHKKEFSAVSEVSVRSAMTKSLDSLRPGSNRKT